jgi:hypothetical protein
MAHVKNVFIIMACVAIIAAVSYFFYDQMTEPSVPTDIASEIVKELEESCEFRLADLNEKFFSDNDQTLTNIEEKIAYLKEVAGNTLGNYVGDIYRELTEECGN